VTDPRAIAPSTSPSTRDAVSDWLDVFTSLLALPPAQAQAIRDELEDHLRSRVEDLLIAGQTEGDAVRIAVEEIGQTAQLAARFTAAHNHTNARRWNMSGTLAIVAGSVLALSTGSLLINQARQTPTAPAATQESAGSTIDLVVKIAPTNQQAFDARLQRYDISALIDTTRSLELSAQGQNLTISIAQLVQNVEWNIGGQVRSRASVPSPVADAQPSTGTMIVLGGLLFVEADPQAHAKIAWVLGSLAAEVDRNRARHDETRAQEEAARQADREQNTRQVAELAAQIEQTKDRLLTVVQKRSHADYSHHTLMTQWESTALAERADLTPKLAQLAAETELLDFERRQLQRDLEELSERHRNLIKTGGSSHITDFMHRIPDQRGQ
jgi:hypothetical protein